MLDYLLEHTIKGVVFWLVGALVVVSAAAITGFIPFMRITGVSPDQYQAVFLANNQVYFGKLTDENPSYVRLTDVYYLKSGSDLESASNVNLIKLGGELHGPEDQMFIAKKSILFWENMKNTSRVVQTILTSKN